MLLILKDRLNGVLYWFIADF